jgi:transcriptional regulator with XRE-family HTH domain
VGLMEKPIMEQLGNNIRLERRRHGLSQQALAEKAEVGVASVARLEAGMLVNVELATLSKIARALDTNVKDLLPSEDSLK